MSESPTSAAVVRRWWLPSISICIWIAFFLALNLSPLRVKLVGADGDPCWHWRLGSWMIEHRAVTRTDEFSHTHAGGPFINWWWLSEVLLAAAGNWLGWSGIVLLSAVVIATGMWLLHRQLLAENRELLLSTVLVLLAASACATHWLARPHLATQIMVLIFAWQLRWFDRGLVNAKRLLILLPVLMALWVNLHGAFVFGWLLVGIYFVAATVEYALAAPDQHPPLRRKMGVLALLGVACVLASLANPYGWNLPLRVVRYMRSPLLMGFSQEYLSPDFHSPGTTPFLLILLAVLLMLLIVRPRLRLVDGMLFLTWLILSLRMVRNVPLFALVITPIIAEHWDAYLHIVRETSWTQRYRRLSVNLTAVDQKADGRCVALLAVVVMIAVLTLPRLFGGSPPLKTEIPADKFPVAAVEFLRASPSSVNGQMFNDFMWGGYLMLALPERKVFIHPNLDVYGKEVVREFNKVDDVQPGWQKVFQKYDVGWTILPVKHPLNQVLMQRSDWQVAYSDDVAVIFRHKP